MNASQRKYGNLCSKKYNFSSCSIKSETSTKRKDDKKLKEYKETKIKPAPLFVKLAHRLRLAVYEGNSLNPRKNQQLSKVMKNAVEQGMPMQEVQNVVDHCKKECDPLHTHVIQIRCQHRIYVIITVHSESLQSLKHMLMPILKRCDGAFGYVIPFFDSSTSIEALVSYHTAAADFQNLETAIVRDGHECKAKDIEMVDFETGAVNFKCSPSELLPVCKALQDRNYVLLHVEYSFVPKSRVTLNWHEKELYLLFLKKIWNIPNVLKIFDNVNKSNM